MIFLQKIKHLAYIHEHTRKYILENLGEISISTLFGIFRFAYWKIVMWVFVVNSLYIQIHQDFIVGRKKVLQ